MVMDIFMSFVWSQQKEDTQMYSTALASYQQVNRFPVELSTEVDARGTRVTLSYRFSKF